MFAECPNCKLPLLRMLALDTRDRRLNLGDIGTPFLEILFCWRCPLRRDFSYRHRGAYVEIVTYEEGPPDCDFPYQNYPDAFPEAECILEPMPQELQAAITEHNRLNEAGLSTLQVEYPEGTGNELFPRHQIGGEPFLWNPLDKSFRCCTLCGSGLEFLAAVADDNLDPRGFVSCISVQALFFLCRGCKLIRACNQTD